MKLWWQGLEENSRLILKIFGGMVVVALFITMIQCGS